VKPALRRGKAAIRQERRTNFHRKERKGRQEQKIRSTKPVLSLSKDLKFETISID